MSSAWIHIKVPDPNLQQSDQLDLDRAFSWIRIWIRINLQMTTWQAKMYEIGAYLSLYLEAMIRIRIKLKSRIRI